MVSLLQNPVNFTKNFRKSGQKPAFPPEFKESPMAAAGCC
jgi:hypothetical protein